MNTKFTILEWNICCGGFPGYKEQTPPPPMMKKIIEGVKKIDADFVTLIDTYLWDSIFTNSDLQTMFGYPYAHTMNLNDRALIRNKANNGITVLSKHPILDYNHIRILTRDALQTTIQVSGKALDIFSVYLDHESESVRLLQMEALLSRKTSRNKTILIGDLNALAPGDVPFFKECIFRLLASLPFSFMDDAREIYEKIRHRRVIFFIQSRGLSDASTGSELTIPTKKISFFIPPLFKLDYCFISSGINVNRSYVPHGGVFTSVSDHYPLITELELES